MKLMTWRLARWMGGCALAAGLAACGGGGGGGGGGTTSPPAGLEAGTLRVHYQRPDAIYTNWAVYSWNGPTTPSTGWPGNPRFVFERTDGYGAYVDIRLDTSKTTFDFVLNKGTNGTDTIKDMDCDRRATIASDITTRGQQIWLKSGDCATYANEAAANGISLNASRAMWLSTGTLVWPGATQAGEFRLYHAASGGIAVDSNSGVSGADGFFPLTSDSLSADLQARFRHLATAPAFTVPGTANARQLLKGQLVVVRWLNGKPAGATQVQTQGVLDDVYAASATTQTLGASFAGDGTPTLRLWAPTARSVRVNVQGGASL
ncbi:MAG: hypothetical protein H7Z15_23520, partial [Rhizobacter sp.]|nr:hypothetical protein [Rhizobacter sp.]